MSLAISLRSEFLKTKRSSAWILTLAMAAFAPVFSLLIFKEEHNDLLSKMSQDAWNYYFYQVTGMISVVFLPMYVILMSTLLPQMEYRNHTWKQVFAAPQSYGKLYFSKFLIFQFFIIAFIVAHVLLTGASAVISGMLNPKFNFGAHSLDWSKTINSLWHTYVAVLALSTLQFWMGLRLKSFLIPIGVGVLCSILGMINMLGFHVIDADKFFFNFSAFIVFKENAAKIPDVMWFSTAYAIVILLVGFVDFSRVKRR